MFTDNVDVDVVIVCRIPCRYLPSLSLVCKYTNSLYHHPDLWKRKMWSHFSTPVPLTGSGKEIHNLYLQSRNLRWQPIKLINLLVEKEQLSTIEWLITSPKYHRWHRILNKKKTIDSLIASCIRWGKEEFARHLVDRYRLTVGCESFRVAVKRGDKVVVEWVMSKGNIDDNKKLFMTIGGGDLELVKFVASITKCGITSEMMNMAACQGKLNVLEWAGVDPDDRCACSVTRRGHLRVLLWMKSRGILLPMRVMAIDACIGGHLHILKMLIENGEEARRMWANMAADYGHVHILQWLLEEFNFTPTVRTLHVVIRMGNLVVVKWITINTDIPYDVGCTNIAAAYNRQDIVEWGRVTYSVEPDMEEVERMKEDIAIEEYRKEERRKEIIKEMEGGRKIKGEEGKKRKKGREGKEGGEGKEEGR